MRASATRHLWDANFLALPRSESILSLHLDLQAKCFCIPEILILTVLFEWFYQCFLIYNKDRDFTCRVKTSSTQ